MSPIGEISEKLRVQWEALINALNLVGPQADDLFRRICLCYQQSWRFYHTLDHLDFLFEELSSIRQVDLGEDAALLLAAWFHDIVFDPHDHENELASANYAREALTELGLAAEQIERVAKMILATTHRTIAGDPDTAALCDADLAILGSIPRDYDAYVAMIRREYAFVPRIEYRAGRVAVLEHLLRRERIYQTPEMYAKREDDARNNIRRELTSYRDGTG